MANLRSLLYQRAKNIGLRLNIIYPVWRYSSVSSLQSWLDIHDRRPLPFLTQIREFRRSYVIQANITLYNIKVVRNGVEVVEQVVNPVFTIPNVIRLTQAMVKQKLREHIDIIMSNAYNLRIIDTGDQVAMDLSPAGIYRNPIFMSIQDDIQYTISSTNNIRNYRFENLPIRNFNDPILCSIGINSQEWNTKKNECGVNALLHQFQGRDRFKNMTRASVYDDINLDEDEPITVNSIINFCLMHDITVYIVGISNKLEYKNISKNQQHEAFYFKIANDHLYPIDDDELRKQIRYSVDNSISIDIDWGNSMIFNFEKGNTNELYGYILEVEKTSTESSQDKIIFIKTYWDMTDDEIDQSNLNNLANYIYQSDKIIVENLRLDSNGNINTFTYKSCWVIFNSDYHKIKEILAIVKELDVIKDKQNYLFRNQTIQNITKSLIESYRGEIPKSNLSSKIYDLFKFYMRGAYNDTINTDIKFMDCQSFDISKCYTSIVYHRKHNWGIFMPWDDLQPYNGGLVHGAKYIINKPDLQIGEIKLGNKLYDSEFVEKLLDNNFIDYSNIKFELIPSKVLPCDYFKKLIDIIYNIIGNEKGYAKDMVNLYLGTLGKHVNKTITGEISTSISHKNLWISNTNNTQTLNKVKSIVENKFMVLFSEESDICRNTNIPIFYGIIDMSYWKLYELQLAVCDKNSEVMKFHSDSITVRNPKKNVIGKSLYSDTLSQFGKIRSEVLDCAVCPTRFMKIENFKTDIYENINKSFNEVNTNDIDEIIKNHGSFALFGKPGRGKTYTCCNDIKKALEKYEYKYIGTSTSNKAVNNLRSNGLDSTTLCSLFIIRLDCSEDGMLREINRKYNYIICDEYTMNNLQYMEYLYTLHKMGTRIIFVGDKHQLPAVEKSNIVFNYCDLDFFREICDYKYIELKINHRFDAELDSIIAKIYDEGVFEMPIRNCPTSFPSEILVSNDDGTEEGEEEEPEIIQSKVFFYEPDFEPDFDEMQEEASCVELPEGDYFKKTKYNICYHRKAKKEINDIYMNDNKNNIEIEDGDKLIIRNDCYIKGSPVICKDNISGRSEDGLFNNTLFDIVSWDDNNVILLNDKSIQITITRELFQSKLKNGKGFTFEPGHAFTTHCAQGSTILGDLCVWETDCMSRELLYTALSRATALSHIYIHNYNPLNDIRKENFSMIGDSSNIEYLDRERKPFSGSIYEIYNIETQESLYVGSTKNKVDNRLREHKDEINKDDLTCEFHLHIKNNNIPIGIKEISRVYFDDVRELHQAEYNAIKQYIKNGIKIYNTKGIKLPKKRKLKVGEYKSKKNNKVRGCILVLHDRVRFRYSINGKKKEKSFFTKKIGEAKALKLAREFQKSVYE